MNPGMPATGVNVMGVYTGGRNLPVPSFNIAVNWRGSSISIKSGLPSPFRSAVCIATNWFGASITPVTVPIDSPCAPP